MVIKFHLAVFGFLVFILGVPTDAQDNFIQLQPENVIKSNMYSYGYDSLLSQLNKWRLNPYIVIDSIGKSVQGRAVWMLSIKGEQNHSLPVYRVTIHARTHPGEIQSQMLTHKIIEFLTGDSMPGTLLRERFIFNIVPMYNPDGVELGSGRMNANGIDLERNWFTFPNEPEVAALKNKFIEFMGSAQPVCIALNMHGDGGAVKDYFVFHHQAGTSAQFEIDQKEFIGNVRSHYVTGIHDWNYFISWTSGNPMVYPESWFWANYAEGVMALTFEQISTASANDTRYDSAAYALLKGIMDYLDVVSEAEEFSGNEMRAAFELMQNYPNPFNPTTTISYNIPLDGIVMLKIFNTMGEEVATLYNAFRKAGAYSKSFDASKLTSGVYFYRLTVGDFTVTKKMVLLK
ncbi:MAG: M14 family zinc carboxypeptidase [Ignavibacteriaceae bacterium]